MRHITLVIFLCGTAFGQSIMENAAGAAGGSVGGVAGKKVSDGITAIFGKVDKQTAKAAETGKDSKPLLEVGPGVPKGTAAESVPPPPPLANRAAVHRAVPRPMPMLPVMPVILRYTPAPPPEVTRDVLKQVGPGTQRADVLNLGEPTARITMFDDGHLVETYRYVANDRTFGVVQLSDGAVSKVDVH
ncbi:MAG: hypothetical protein ABSB35_27450 [Bryobacteraceae bacterium]|jgi:hypothetical protein